MGVLWFWLVGCMIVAYVVLDGFDLGTGILHLYVAQNEGERRMVVQSIGPVWDGNEVWLLAGGGTLYFAFPWLYASAFSGFYLPLMIVLWLLMVRGITLELRNHIELGVWRALLDGLFGLSSTLLAIFLGAALANVIRGVPLQADGYFFLPLWTNWQPGVHPGVLDWYTVLGGLLACAALAMHGALWLSVKTTGAVESRVIRIVPVLWGSVAVLTLVSLPATMRVQPATLVNYNHYPITYIIPLGVALCLSGALIFHRKRQALRAFGCSSGYLALMLVGACWGLFPTLLPATTGADRSIRLEDAISSPYTLHVGLLWWIFGIGLAALYFSISYWMFRGKVRSESMHG